MYFQRYFEDSKPPQDAEANVLHSQPQASLESIVEQAGEFTEFDNEFIQSLLTDFQPALNVNQLMSHIVLEIAHGSVTNCGRLGDTTKLRISNKVGEFEDGKFLHFVLAMLHKNDEAISEATSEETSEATLEANSEAASG